MSEINNVRIDECDENGFIQTTGLHSETNSPWDTEGFIKSGEAISALILDRSPEIVSPAIDVEFYAQFELGDNGDISCSDLTASYFDDGTGVVQEEESSFIWLLTQTKFSDIHFEEFIVAENRIAAPRLAAPDWASQWLLENEGAAAEWHFENRVRASILQGIAKVKEEFGYKLNFSSSARLPKPIWTPVFARANADFDEYVSEELWSLHDHFLEIIEDHNVSFEQAKYSYTHNISPDSVRDIDSELLSSLVLGSSS